MFDDRVDISDLDKAELLAALYNNAMPQGMGFLHYDPKPMTRDEAAQLLEKQKYFDYLKGRVMKIDLTDSKMWTAMYNRDNGPNAAEDVIAQLRAK